MVELAAPARSMCLPARHFSMKAFLFAAAIFLQATLLRAAPPTLGGVAASPSGATATISGTVSSNGAATTVRVDFGETTDYGSTVRATDSFSAAASNSPFTIALSALKYATTYHYKVTASNGESPDTSSGDLTFTIPAEAPGVGAPSVNVLDSTQATITSTITAKGATTMVRVDFGTTNALGTSAASTTIVLADGSSAVDITLTGLSKTTYFYKVIATNSVGTTESSLLQFTVPQAPQVTASATPGVSSAKVVAKVTAHGEAVKLTLSYGTTTAYGSTLVINGVAENAVNLSQTFDVTGLSRNTTYNYQVRAEHSGGNATTANATFKTLANRSPVAKADSVQTDARNPVTVAVLANDSDPDGDPVTLETVSKPQRGTIAVSDDKVIYTPGSAFKGRDEFTYTIADDQSPAGVATGRVTISSPAVVIQGVNTAIITDEDDNAAGAYKIVGAANGKFTARVSIGGTDSVVMGQLDSEGKFSAVLPNGTSVKFEIKQSGATNSITAEFERDGKSYSSDTPVNALTGARKQALAGLYTLSIPAPGARNTEGETNSGLPEGAGFIRMTVKEWGGVRVQGLLGDGSKFSYASSLSGTDTASVVPLWLSPKDARVSGTIALTGTDTLTATGNLKWFRQPGDGGNRFNDGFFTTVNASGGAYVAPEKNERVLNAADSKANITLQGGDLTGSIVRNFSIDKNNRAQLERGVISKLSLDPVKGLFIGTFEHPFDGDKRTFQGVILSQTSKATGVFTGRTQTGTVDIAPGTITAPAPTPQQPDPDENGGIDLGNGGLELNRTQR